MCFSGVSSVIAAILFAAASLAGSHATTSSDSQKIPGDMTDGSTTLVPRASPVVSRKSANQAIPGAPFFQITGLETLMKQTKAPEEHILGTTGVNIVIPPRFEQCPAAIINFGWTSSQTHTLKIFLPELSSGVPEGKAPEVGLEVFLAPDSLSTPEERQKRDTAKGVFVDLSEKVEGFLKTLMQDLLKLRYDSDGLSTPGHQVSASDSASGGGGGGGGGSRAVGARGDSGQRR